MSKDLWMAEYDQIAEDWQIDGDDEALKSRMKRLGFDRDEIESHLDSLKA